MEKQFGDDPMDEYVLPVSVRKTKLAQIFTMKERARPEKPGRSLNILWDDRKPLIPGFVNRCSYVVRFTQPKGRAGNHYHELKEELFFALHGQLTVILEDPATREREEIQLTAGDNQVVYIPVHIAHVVVSNTTDDLLMVIASHYESDNDEIPYEVAS